MRKSDAAVDGLSRTCCHFSVRFDQLEFMKAESGAVIFQHYDHGPVRIDENHGADFSVFRPHQIAGFQFHGNSPC